MPQAERRGHHVTEIHVPDTFTDMGGNEVYDLPDSIDWAAWDREIQRAHDPMLPITRQGIYRMNDAVGANCEALLAVLSPNGPIPFHFDVDPNGNASAPTWVWSDNERAARLLSDRFQVDGYFGEDRFPGLEDTHSTRFGPPGVVPGARLDFNGAMVNGGRQLLAQQVSGLTTGYSGTATATTATSLTATGTPWASNAYSGFVVDTPTAWANIETNTTGALTLDRWYTYATPGGAAAGTPGATTTFTIRSSSVAAQFMALTANSSAAVGTDASLTGEIVTAGGGLVRKIGAVSVTSATSPATWTLTTAYTANGSDALPVTVAKIGCFVSMVVADVTLAMVWETLLNASATLTTSGDQVTVTDTYTGP